VTSTSPELAIKWEWEPSESVRAPELAATWARIEIWAGLDCVSLVEDRESGSSRRSIYCPLYPLAEWIAYNWWSLQADARPARQFGLRSGSMFASHSAGAAALRRHSIRASGDGFLWPDLVIVPEGKQARLAWRREPASLTGRMVRFLTQGDTLVDRDAAINELGLVVSGVLTRLAEQGVVETPLQKEWQEIQNSDPDEVAYCLAAARLGLDPYSEAVPYEEAIIRASEVFSGRLLEDFLDGVDPGSIDADLYWLEAARKIISQSNRTAQGEAVRTLRKEITALVGYPASASHPWETGWRQARILRNTLGMDVAEPFDLGSFITSVDRKVGDRGLLAVGAAADQSDPVVVTGQRRPADSRRFTLARALWHYFWDSETFFIVTTAYTDLQKVERAFAAELLAPADGIAELLTSRPEAASPEDLDQLAHEFRVSSMVVEHQLQNQLLSDAS
jgi:hypothetical protein